MKWEFSAWQLLEQHAKDEYQRYHALIVATAMEGYAQHYGEDPDLWYLAGLLHDLDFEEFPEEHPGVTLQWFREWGYPEEFIQAVESHAYGYHGFRTLPPDPPLQIPDPLHRRAAVSPLAHPFQIAAQQVLLSV